MNVSTRQLDLEQIDEPDGCLRHRPLPRGIDVRTRPGSGRARGNPRASARRRSGRQRVGAGDEQPMAHGRLRCRPRCDGHDRAAPRSPGAFSLGDRDRLVSLFVDAGAADIDSAEVAVPMRAPSFDAWWERTCALAGPLAKALSSLPPHARDAIREHAREAVQGYEQPGLLELPGLALLVWGRKT